MASEIAQAKAVLRTRHLRARRERTDRSRADARLTAQVIDLLKAMSAHSKNPQAPIAAYSPLHTEPGGAELLPALRATGREIWLPISLADGTLMWARDSIHTQVGALGVTEPLGEQHTSAVLKDCAAIFLPALAADREGFRLGKGAGYYDRALSTLGRIEPTGSAHPLLVTLIYASEMIDRLERETHDVPGQAIITEKGTFWAAENVQKKYEPFGEDL